MAATVDVGSRGSNEKYLGLVARYQGPGDTNMYLGWLGVAQGRFYLQIHKNVSGRWTLLALKEVSTGSGRLDFTVYGSSLRLSLNDSELLTAVDSDIDSAGRLGIRAYYQGAKLSALRAGQALPALSLQQAMRTGAFYSVRVKGPSFSPTYVRNEVHAGQEVLVGYRVKRETYDQIILEQLYGGLTICFPNATTVCEKAANHGRCASQVGLATAKSFELSNSIFDNGVGTVKYERCYKCVEE